MNKHALISAHNLIKPFIHNTPVLTSEYFNSITQSQLFFKCENFQKTGSFKIRGATNAVLNLSPEQKQNGIVTHSSGNFAQALALAAKINNIKAYIVMPENSLNSKLEAVKSYGAQILKCKPTIADREKTADKLISAHNAAFIHPYNDKNIIAGHATATIELLETYPDLEYIIAPVGGGGLISGTALAAYYFGNNCKVIGAEPLEADDAYRSLISGKIEINKTPNNTIADGLRTNLGDITFNFIRKYVQSIIRISEIEIITAMQLVYERMKIIIEPSSAVAVAAAVKYKFNSNSKVGIIISGGNADLSLYFNNIKKEQY
ncbi:MAG: pyridoxal-phosphate dependent enzyme [Bacteroidales bacterium]|nr:pyridoxal-phosphate dependent enzyme [Bacteroidales bacterium]